MTTVGVSGRRARLVTWSPYRKAKAASAIRRSNGRARTSSTAAFGLVRRTASKPSAESQSATASHSIRLGDAMMMRGRLLIETSLRTDHATSKRCGNPRALRILACCGPEGSYEHRRTRPRIVIPRTATSRTRPLDRLPAARRRGRPSSQATQCRRPESRAGFLDRVGS